MEKTGDEKAAYFNDIREYPLTMATVGTVLRQDL